MLGNETLSRAPKTLESEADAYAFLEGLRWGDDGPTQCPHCGSEKGAWYLKPKDPEGRKSKGGSAARSQRRVWKCRENSCRRQFSVLTNTVLHATKMPVRAWIGTIIDLCEDPSGVSARQVAARWEITEKSAWAMLNRIQEALNEPEVAGAQLDSNAPLWFEVAPEVAAVFEEERRARDAAAAEELVRQKQAEQKAAQAIERDVQRALAEAAVGQIAPEVAAETGVKTVFSGAERVADSRSEGGVDPSISRPERAPNQGMAKPAIGPEGERPTAPEGTDRSSKRRDPDVENQVKSDVERALAEVFGDALPRQNTSQTQPERPPQPTAERDLSEAVYAPDSVQRPKKTPPDQRADGEPTRPLERAESRASEGGAEPGAAEPKPQNGAGNKRSKAARKKRKQARIAARKRSLETSNERPQPVDNPSDVDGESATADERRTLNQVSRAQARRVEKARSGPTEVPFDEHADLLGGGWLDGSPPQPLRDAHVVSSEQGQLHGITASELGPSWASDSSDVSAETPSKSRPSENQLNFFSDETDADT